MLNVELDCKIPCYYYVIFLVSEFRAAATAAAPWHSMSFHEFSVRVFHSLRQNKYFTYFMNEHSKITPFNNTFLQCMNRVFLVMKQVKKKRSKLLPELNRRQCYIHYPDFDISSTAILRLVKYRFEFSTI